MRQRVAIFDARGVLWHLSCNLQLRRDLLNCTARLAVGAALALAMCCAVLAPQLVTASLPASPVATAPLADQIDLPPPDSSTTDSQPGEKDGEPDIYGNEVTAAVAKYTYDATGSLYEVHSPQTEVPRLGSPKS